MHSPIFCTTFCHWLIYLWERKIGANVYANLLTCWTCWRAVFLKLNFMFVYSLLPCTAAAATLCVQFRSYRSPYDTKARRARELRPRRNYMLPEEVEQHRKSRLQEKPETADTSAQEEFVGGPRDFRYDSMKYLKLHMHVSMSRTHTHTPTQRKF